MVGGIRILLKYLVHVFVYLVQYRLCLLIGNSGSIMFPVSRSMLELN